MSVRRTLGKIGSGVALAAAVVIEGFRWVGRSIAFVWRNKGRLLSIGMLGLMVRSCQEDKKEKANQEPAPILHAEPVSGLENPREAAEKAAEKAARKVKQIDFSQVDSWRSPEKMREENPERMGVPKEGASAGVELRLSDLDTWKTPAAPSRTPPPAPHEKQAAAEPAEAAPQEKTPASQARDFRSSGSDAALEQQRIRESLRNNLNR